MSSRPPAIRHDEIIAAVATLQSELLALHGMLKRMESKLNAIDATVSGQGGHDDQIKAWRRDGKWLAAALTGLGALGSLVLARVFDWLGNWAPPPSP